MTRATWTRRRRTSVATRLGLSAMVVCLVAILVTFVVGVSAGRSHSADLIDDRLEAVRGGKIVAVRSFVETLRAQTRVLATSPMTLEALTSFADAYDEIDPASSSDESVVATWYREEYLPQLSDAEGRAPALSSFLPGTPAAVTLQRAYTIAEEPPPRSSVDDAGDGSEWSAVHQDYHSTFKQVVDLYGLADLYLIDRQGRIVYSTMKAPDFGTDLNAGPYSGTPLAQIVRQTLVLAIDDAIADLAPYPPSSAEPSGFIAAPVSSDEGGSGGGVVGVVAVQFSSTALSAVASGDDSWAEDGLGDTGETLVIGPDNRVRNDVRAFVESPAEYVDATVERGTLSAEEAATVTSSGTTATLQAVDDDVVGRSAAGPGTTEGTDVLGRAVVMAYAPAGIDGLDWVLLTQITEDELEAGAIDFRNDLIRIAAVVVAVLTIVGVAWANWIVRPVRLISDRLAAGPNGDEAPTRTAGPVEFGRLAQSFELMGDSLRRRHDDVVRATAEHAELLHSMLPPPVADRVARGDRDVLDQVPDASIAVIVIDGVHELTRDHDADHTRRSIDAFIGALDAAADRNGVGRITIIGDTYVAACGHREPVLDHAPRAVAFARDAVRTVSEDSGLDPALGARAAVHTGPVAVGLSSPTRLVYDVWGPTVSECLVLGRSAPSGQVLVSQDAYERLPDEAVAGATAATFVDHAAWVLTTGTPADVGADVRQSGAGPSG